MKRLVLLLLIISAGMFAQRPNHEKIKALKTAHITEQLALTSSEAENFWPIYNASEKEIMALRMKERSGGMSKIHKNGIDSLSNKEANAIIDEMLKMKTTELEYRKKLVTDLRGVIPPTKIIKLQRAEESFKRMLLERLKQRRENRK